jgi:hypothetical protein
MAKKPKALRRGLLGVKSEDVEQILADRDTAAAVAAEQVRAAEERASRSEARASALEAQLAETTQPQEAQETEAPATDPHDLLLAVREEMARVMSATQEAGSKILEHTRSGVEQQLEDSDRLRREIEDDRDRLAAWVHEMKQSSSNLRQSFTDAAGVMNRAMSAIQETERAIARTVGCMAETDGLLHKGPAPRAAVEAPPAAGPHEQPGNSQVIASAEGNGFDPPEPPIDVSERQAIASRTDQDVQPNGSHENSGEALERHVSADGHGENGHTPEGALASSWSAGPVGRQKPSSGD